MILTVASTVPSAQFAEYQQVVSELLQKPSVFYVRLSSNDVRVLAVAASIGVAMGSGTLQDSEIVAAYPRAIQLQNLLFADG
jgi:hypothetical protein